jgi:hypothetical protein
VPEPLVLTFSRRASLSAVGDDVLFRFATDEPYREVGRMEERS